MKAIIITASVFLVMMIGTLGYVIGLSQGLDTTIDKFTIGKKANTITKQVTDDRGLTSVQYIKDGEEWGLDYLTKQEYDSAFHDFVNYRQ